MNTNEFDLDFDFEKEYSSEPPAEEPTPEIDDEFDLRSILGSKFVDDTGLLNSEYDGNFDYSDYPIEPEEEEPPAQETQPDLEQMDDDLAMEEPQDFQEEPEGPARDEPPRRSRRSRAEQPEQPQEQDQGMEEFAAPSRRRKPVSRERQFKNETLPKLIAGVAALLILIFVIGAISRAVKNHMANRPDPAATGDALSAEEQEKKRVQTLLDEAAAMAVGYDYDGAIAKLQSYGDTSKSVEISTRISEYQQAKTKLVAHNDPGMIPNLSFNVLIADPARAFTDRTYGKKYNMNFVTTDEFQKILESLYENNYVLVDRDCFTAETDTNGNITYAAKPLYLPDGKKPVMITETMVNYYLYMVDSNKDGEPDKGGAGFASRLVLQNGEIKAEMVTAAGETVVGDYDLVPILEKFIQEHPDFSFQGSRATLAVSGYNGLFGYRTQASVVSSKGQDYYDTQVNGAKEIISALTEAGYEIACYTYEDKAYGQLNATEIQKDLDKWKTEVVPILGSVDTMVYAKSSDISSTGDYTNSKFNVLYDAGFRHFITSGSAPAMKVANSYTRQVRIEVKGKTMAHAPTTYANFFNAKSILNSQRGEVPNS